MTKAKVEVEGEEVTGPPKYRYVSTFLASNMCFALTWAGLTVLLNIWPKPDFSYPSGEYALRLLGSAIFAVLTLACFLAVFGSWITEGNRVRKVRAREAARQTGSWGDNARFN